MTTHRPNVFAEDVSTVAQDCDHAWCEAIRPFNICGNDNDRPLFDRVVWRLSILNRKWVHPYNGRVRGRCPVPLPEWHQYRPGEPARPSFGQTCGEPDIFGIRDGVVTVTSIDGKLRLTCTEGCSPLAIAHVLGIDVAQEVHQ